MGDISFKLFPENAPKAVENFAGLAKRGYYDGVIFHRVIKKFVSARMLSTLNVQQRLLESETDSSESGRGHTDASDW